MRLRPVQKSGRGVAAIIFERELIHALGKEAVRSVLGGSALTVPALNGPAVDGPESRNLEPSNSVGDRVLLVRRRFRPAGQWCLPCGYVEFDEEIREALVRETREETGLIVHPHTVAAVHSNFHDPDRQSVGVWFHAIPDGGRLMAGDDADLLGLFSPDNVSVPLAFPTDALVLRNLRNDPQER